MKYELAGTPIEPNPTVRLRLYNAVHNLTAVAVFHEDLSKFYPHAQYQGEPGFVGSHKTRQGHDIPVVIKLSDARLNGWQVSRAGWEPVQ